MGFFKKQVFFIALALMAIPTCGYSQYEYDVQPFFSYFKDPQRYDVAFSYMLPMGEFSGVSQVQNGGQYIGDTTKKRTLTGQAAFAGSIGIEIPVKRTGHISCFAVSIGLMAAQTEWNHLNETYSLDNTYKQILTPVNAVTQQFSMPLGFDYKVGCDAIKTKRLLLGATLGVGVLPQYNMTALEGVNSANTGTSFSATPFVKAEGAIFAGMCIKVRVMYTLGNVPLLDISKNLPNKLTDGPFSLTSTSNLLVSLVIMPFSVRWPETAWYNTHDTYNRHDRLN